MDDPLPDSAEKLDGHVTMAQSRVQKADIKLKLLHVLQSDEFGKTPFEIAKLLNISRQTATKYLQELETEGKIKRFDSGPYNVFRFIRPRDDLLFEKLYHFLLNIIQNARESNPGLIEPIIAQFQRNRHKIIKEIDLPSNIDIPDLSKQQKTYENLLTLLEGVRYFIYSLVPSLHAYPIEVLPALDKVKPMSFELRFEDAGFARKGAGFHYQIVANIIQERLSVMAGAQVYFRISRPIEENMPFIYYELGYVDRYFQDFSVFEFDEREASERALLEEVKQFYASMSKLDATEATIDGKLHYKLVFRDNQELEHIYELTMHTAEENTKIAKQLVEEDPGLLSRNWIPIERWPHRPFAVIDCVSNFGYIVDEHVRLSSEADKFGGICVHFERIAGGWRINCMEKVDFEQLFAPMTDWNRRRAIYEKLATNPDEFLRRRNEMIVKNRREHEMKKKGLPP